MDNIRYITTDLDKKIDFYLKKIIDDKTIKENHAKIRKELNIDLKKFKLSDLIVKKLFLIFDRLYFKDLIQAKLYDNNIDIDFGISNKCKNAAGFCKYTRKKIEIIFSNYIFEKIHNDKFKSINISGIICYDLVDVLITLMEHEITHFILFVYDSYKDDVKSGHNSQFKELVYNMYRHTKITHDLLTGDIEEYNNMKEEATTKLKIGMKIQCKKDIGTVINIKPKYILYLTDNKVKACRFNEYNIIDKNYKKYQEHIDKLKKKLKIGVEVRWNKYSGPITKIIDDRVYFRDDNTSRIIWCLIDIIEFV